MAVPPRDQRVRYYRIRFGFFIFLIIICITGIVGNFLIPFRTTPLNVTELHQMRYLTEQNNKLMIRIQKMRSMFFTLRGRIDTLVQTKEHLANTFSTEPVKISGLSKPRIDFSKVTLDGVLHYVNAMDYFHRALIKKIERNKSCVQAVPLIKPVVDEHVITAPYGKIRDPFTGSMKWHYGIDFSAAQETPVVATASGTVDMVEKHPEWGRRIRIRHQFGFATVYAHLGTVKIRKGQKVQKGDVIATIGLSGLTTGPHVHYEVHRNGSPVNPERYLFPEILFDVVLK